MKNIILLLTFYILNPIISKSQQSDTLSIKIINQEDLKDIYKKHHNFNYFQLQDNSTLKIGDTLILGIPNTNQTASISGSTKKIFSSIMIGKIKLFSILSPMSEIPENLELKLIIENIQINYLLVKKELIAFEYITVSNSSMRNIFYTISSIDNAILTGEIIYPNGKMQKKEALKKLKEAKDFLNLEIITQEEYDNLKMKLTPIILNE